MNLPESLRNVRARRDGLLRPSLGHLRGVIRYVATIECVYNADPWNCKLLGRVATHQ